MVMIDGDRGQGMSAIPTKNQFDLINIDPSFKIEYNRGQGRSNILTPEIQGWMKCIYNGESCDRLDGWELVLGRKFNCMDCFWLDLCKSFDYFNNICCASFKLLNKVVDEIKVRDVDINETKIDTHPYFLLDGLKLIL